MSPATYWRLDRGSVCVCVSACVCDSFKNHSSRKAPFCKLLIEQLTLQRLLMSRNFCFRPSLSSVAVEGLGSDPPCKPYRWPAIVSWSLAGAMSLGSETGGLITDSTASGVFASVSLHPQVPVGGADGTRCLRRSAQSALSHSRGPLSWGSLNLLVRTSALCSRRRHCLFLPRPLARQTALT